MKLADVTHSLPHTTSQVTQFITMGELWPAPAWPCWQGSAGLHMHSLTMLPAGPAGAQRHGPHPGCPMVCCCRAQVRQQPALSHRHLHSHAQGSSCWRAALPAGAKQGWRPRVFAAARAPEPGAETQCQRRPPGAAQGGRGAAVQGASGGGLPRGPGHCLATGARSGACCMCYAEHGAEPAGDAVCCTGHQRSNRHRRLCRSRTAPPSIRW